MLKQAVCALTLAAALTVNLPCHANEEIGHLAFDFSDSRYEEPGLMKETGVFYGLHMDWLGVIDHVGAIGIRAQYRGSDVDYDGATQSGTPVKSKGRDSVLGIEVTYGWTFRPGGIRVTPYSGIGYRNWRDRIEDSTTAGGTPVYGYRREIVYFYLPVGLHFADAGSERWGWTARAQGNYLIRGKVYSHLEDTDPGYDTLNNTQKHGYGYEVAVAWSYHFNDDRWVGFFVEPYYTYWKIKDSDKVDLNYYGVPIGYAYEPANKTKVVGVRVGWEYR